MGPSGAGLVAGSMMAYGIFAVLVDVVGTRLRSPICSGVGFTGRFLLGQMHFCPVVGSGCILGNDERVQVALQILLEGNVSSAECTGYGKFVALAETLHRGIGRQKRSLVSSTAPAGSSSAASSGRPHIARQTRWSTWRAPLCCTGTKVSLTFST